MSRRGPAIALALGLVMGSAGACGDGDEGRALAAFRELVDRPDLSYRVASRVTMSSGAAARVVSETAIVVVGDDWAMSIHAPDEPGLDLEVAAVGDRLFTRYRAGEWTNATRSFAPLDMSSILRTIGWALEPAGVDGRAGRRLYRLVSREPFELAAPGDGGISTTVLVAEVLIDEGGRPVEGVMRSSVSTTNMSEVLTHLSFSDVGATLSIEAPDVP